MWHTTVSKSPCKLGRNTDTGNRLTILHEDIQIILRIDIQSGIYKIWYNVSCAKHDHNQNWNSKYTNQHHHTLYEVCGTNGKESSKERIDQNNDRTDDQCLMIIHLCD